MIVPFEDCCGWFCNLLSSSGSWETRHCLLAGRSHGEDEVGWSIVAFGMKCKRHCPPGYFIARQSL
ncbi:unnamed protein product [Penicillium nalgiovense]|nr:unnamed protein product [Penicillium nalgiovense]